MGWFAQILQHLLCIGNQGLQAHPRMKTSSEHSTTTLHTGTLSKIVEWYVSQSMLPTIDI